MGICSGSRSVCRGSQGPNPASLVCFFSLPLSGSPIAREERVPSSIYICTGKRQCVLLFPDPNPAVSPSCLLTGLKTKGGFGNVNIIFWSVSL